MTIDSSGALFLTFAFLVPGFIWYSVQSAIFPKKTNDKEMLFLRFLTFSCFNYAFWSWLIYLFLYSDFLKSHLYWTVALWFIIIFVSPFLMGILTGLASQKQIIRNFISKTGFASIHSIPTAWDYKFYKSRSPLWVKVELKDGKQILGLYGNESFASSAADERDLFIEQAMKIKDGKWEKINRSDGILIVGDQIKYVEFIK